MFDTEIEAVQTVIGTPTDEALAAGVPPHLEFRVVTGITLPIANPASGEPITVPVGQYRFSLSKEAAVKLFTEALEAAERLPDLPARSNVITASNMADVERAAAQLTKVTGR